MSKLLDELNAENALRELRHKKHQIRVKKYLEAAAIAIRAVADAASAGNVTCKNAMREILLTLR